jgi:hypothetical protein
VVRNPQHIQKLFDESELFISDLVASSSTSLPRSVGTVKNKQKLDVDLLQSDNTVKYGFLYGARCWFFYITKYISALGRNR